MDKTPSPSFARPRLGWFLVLDGGIAVLTTLAFNDQAYRKARDTAPLPEQAQLRQMVVGTAGLHVLEALVARRSARRKGLDPRIVRRWTRQTFVVGFPSLLKLRKVAAA